MPCPPWTRSQRLRTLAQILIEVELRGAANTPIYQSIAPRVVEMHRRGFTLKAIGDHFGVDDHTAAKALQWFRQR